MIFDRYRSSHTPGLPQATGQGAGMRRLRLACAGALLVCASAQATEARLAVPQGVAAELRALEQTAQLLQQWTSEQCPEPKGPLDEAARTALSLEVGSIRAGWDATAQKLAAQLTRLNALWQERAELAQCATRARDSSPCRTNQATRETIDQLRREASQQWSGSVRRLGALLELTDQQGECLSRATIADWVNQERQYLGSTSQWLGGAVSRLQALR